jgi:hypothetical protein
MYLHYPNLTRKTKVSPSSERQYGREFGRPLRRVPHSREIASANYRTIELTFFNQDFSFPCVRDLFYP